MTVYLATLQESFKGLKQPFIAGIIALTVSYLLTPYVRKLAIHKGAVDDPTRDDRRVHTEPIPRWGGLAIYAGILISVVTTFLINGQPLKLYIIGILLIGAILMVAGALDDIYQYKAKVQAGILFLAGIAVQFFYNSSIPNDWKLSRVHIYGFDMPFSDQYVWLAWAAIPLTAIYIFIVTKTMDTIDGIDGLTAGIATIAGGTLTLIAVFGQQPRVAILAAAVAGSALGFLRHNYNPAKIFMGTGGAYVLGFTLACLSVVGTLKTAAAGAIFMPLLIFGLPLIDAVMVVTRRILNKVPITQADKRHMHHELLARGLSQKQTVWVLYIAAAVLCTSGLLLIRVFGSK